MPIGKTSREEFQFCSTMPGRWQERRRWLNFQYLDRHRSIKEDEEVEQRGGRSKELQEMVIGRMEMMAFGKDLTRTKAFDYKGG